MQWYGSVPTVHVHAMANRRRDNNAISTQQLLERHLVLELPTALRRSIPAMHADPPHVHLAAVIDTDAVAAVGAAADDDGAGVSGVVGGEGLG